MAQATSSPTPSSISQDTIDEFVGNAHGNLARVQELLSDHPDILLLRARWDEDALGAASHAGNRPITEYLLSVGAPLNLPAAAMLGRLDDVQGFLAQDEAAANGAGAHGLSILYHASSGGSVPVAALLLDRGVDVNTGDGANTALHAAAGHGNSEMVRWLLDHGANPEVRDYEDKTPIEIARENGHQEIVALLTP